MVAYTKIYFHLLYCHGQRRILQGLWEEAIPEPQLEFRMKLALGMLENNLDYEGMSTKSPILSKKWYIGPGIPGNDIVSCPTHTGMWNTGDNGWTKN